jgi:hypothetical protein
MGLCAKLLDGIECGQPAQYEIHTVHMSECPVAWDQAANALCGEHASDFRQTIAAQRTLITCDGCGAAYWQLRSLVTSA